MGIGDRLRKLEQEAKGQMPVIPQGDGTGKKFPSGAGIDACTNFMERLGAGKQAPPEYPLIEAARNFSEPTWQRSYFAVEDPDEGVKPVRDLSQEIVGGAPLCVRTA